MPNRTLVGELLWAPWSIAAYVMTLAWMGMLASSALMMTAFRPFHEFQARYPQPQTSWSLWFALSPLRVRYDPAHDRGRVSVFAQNHISMLDANVACGTIKQPICGLENAAHLRIPGYGWLLRLGNAIAVERGSDSKYAEVAAAMQERASRGISVLTFPEGHRTLDGKIRPFRKGVFMIARDAGLPVVPVAVRGLYRVLPKGTFVIRPTPIEVYVGPQVEMAGLSDDEVVEVMNEVHAVMSAWVERGQMLGERLAGTVGRSGQSSVLG